MEYLPLIGTVLLVHILAAMSPGPDFIMVIRNSLAHSRKAGIWTAIGLGLGIAVHIFYCLAGLAVLISQSIIIFTTVKLLGAAYLIYIGYKSLTSTASHITIDQSAPKEQLSHWKALRTGVLTNILNPKVTLFFLSLFTLVISPDTPFEILGIISIMLIVNTMLWFALVATIFTHKKVRRAFEKFQGAFHKVFGGLLVALGLKVALSE